MGFGLLKNIRHTFHIFVMDPGDKGSFRAQGNGEGIEGLIQRAKRGRLGFCALSAGGRILSFGQAVDSVIEHKDVKVYVTSQGVDQVVTANTQGVAIAGDNPDREVRVGQLQAGGDGRGRDREWYGTRRYSYNKESGRRNRCPK